jgi:DNA-binding GntR family transcriptional regulator
VTTPQKKGGKPAIARKLPQKSASTAKPAKAEAARPGANGKGPADEHDASSNGVSGPRYLQIARELTAAISGGQYPVGARLPTELELCEHFQISRFTAREAVRVLSSAGLVTRRQRVGTVVIATPADARYTHSVSSVGDLFQYAQDTEMSLMFIGKVALAKDKATQFGAAAGEEWVYAVGMRRESTLAGAKGHEQGGRPICITRLYLSPELKGIESKLRERKTAVYAIIEREYGLMIQRVEQDLQSVALDADDAANLGATAGSPALMIVRRYFDDRGRLVEVAENIHPGERFTYRMQLHK